MLKRIFLLTVLITVIAFAGTAFAQTVPPAHGGYSAGWGLNPNNWNNYTGSYNSGLALYDPLGAGAGAGWNVFPSGNPIVYDPITLELWIEMYMIQTYYYTSYQWHRLGNAAETVTFTIDGTVMSNNGQYIQLIAGTDPMTHLYWRHNIFGGGTMGVGGSNNARDIPISWEYRWGDGLTIGSSQIVGWTSYTPDPDITFLIEDACDHWYQFRGSFDLVYHEADGYYSLTLAGCPAPTL
jgi:hypothetical protein